MSNTSRRNKQLIIASMCGAVGLGAMFVVSQTLNSSTPGLPIGQSESGVTTTMIADRTRAAAPEMSWIKDAATELDDLRDKYVNLETSVQTMVENHEAEKAQTASEYDAILSRYEETINALQQRLEAGQGGAHNPASGTTQSTGFNLPGSDMVADFLSPAAVRPPANGPLGPQTSPNNNSGGTFPIQGQAGTGAAASGTTPGFEPIPFSRQFTLTSSGGAAEEEDVPPHLSNYLPAGSYAPAIVLSGVDASTSVTSQAEPVPVVFRITSPAITAGTRSTQGHTIDLTGCTVTGSARGDLSSERVYVRLLKLSCVQSGGRVFERDVAGYMSGAGKAGARGLVVSREGRLINNAAIAGALGGLADGIKSVGDAASGAEATSFEDVLNSAGASSAAGGVSGAANRLSEYYIERAEQYQPVVSLYGGTQVELVFMEGVNLE
ncbi:TrbI/VirB10 family protein [Yoonia sp. GPGPB17]|uniref:TrbI/VirB10 family protein n=1 Tax=Yoonia sp. GPGPB17 TaxID=3026147 RepID=UPI0030BE7514